MATGTFIGSSVYAFLNLIDFEKNTEFCKTCNQSFTTVGI